MSTTVLGEPVSPEEMQELTDLRDLFKPSESIKSLDAFSTWLFATTAVVGSLGTALGFIKFSELHGDARRIFELAVLALGLSLALSALARIPQLARTNLHSASSMRKQINRILIVRACLLAAAGFAFAAALGLAAYAPWQSERATSVSATGFSYTLGEEGHLKAKLVVQKAKPLSSAVVELRPYPFDAHVVHPRARTVTSVEGAALLEVDLAHTEKLLRVVFFGRWTDRNGRVLVGRVNIPIRERLKLKP